MDARELRRRMIGEVPEGVMRHIDRVVRLTRRLAEQHGLDLERSVLAAQGHDLLRASDPEALLSSAEARGWRVDPVERHEPMLLHGPVGAIELRDRFGILDRSVLQAVRWHTTGHPDFDQESWAVFVADKVEPEKLQARPQLQRVADLAEGSLRAAALAYLDDSLRRAAEEGWALHPVANAARNALLFGEIRS